MGGSQLVPSSVIIIYEPSVEVRLEALGIHITRVLVPCVVMLGYERVQHQGKVPILSAAFSKLLQKKKSASAQGSSKFREVSNSFCECIRIENTVQTKVSYLFEGLRSRVV